MSAAQMVVPSYMGLHSQTFEQEFKKLMNFWLLIDDLELLYELTQFLDVRELLRFFSVSKKLNKYQKMPLFEVRILKEKIGILQKPRDLLIGYKHIPSYLDFMFKPKVDKQELIEKTSVAYEKLAMFQKNIKKYRELKKNTLLKQQSKAISQKQTSDVKIINKIQKETIDSNQQLKNDTVILSKEPQPLRRNHVSYVEKYRREYKKIKELEQKRNIERLQQLHRKKQEEEQRIKGLPKKFNCDDSVPIIHPSKEEQIVKVRSLEPGPFGRQAQTMLRRFKFLLGIEAD